MWKKWFAFSGMLVLVMLLDPTLTPAQPGGKGGKWGKGGGAPGGATFGPREGGSGERPTFGGNQPGGQRPSWMTQSGGNQPGGPQPGGMGPSGPGGPGGGGPRRGGMSPDFGWRMLQGLTGSNGSDTVDLSKIPPDRRAGLDSMAQRTGGLPLPTSGVWTKDDYAAFHAKSEEARASFNPGNPGGQPNSMSITMGSDGRMSMDPRGRDRGTGNWGGGEWGGAGWGGGELGGGWGNRPFEKKDTEEERPVAMRYGKLPQGLPGWYDELDTDKDGQVALFEWRKGARDTKEFTEMDLNGDGLVTADEYLRFARQRNIDVKLEAYAKGERESGDWGLGEKLNGASNNGKGDTRTKGPGFGPGSGGPKGDNGKGPGRGENRGDKSERKGNPWSKKN